MRHHFNNETVRHDVYDRATQTIIAALERGVKPWTQPWSAGNTDGHILKPLRHNGAPYSGINVLNLWCEAQDKGFTSPTWMTFNQAKELGGRVRRGEHGTAVVYANTFQKVKKDDGGVDVEEDIPFLKQYTVFNTQQIENLPEHLYDKPPPRTNPITRLERAEEFFRNTGADIRTGGSRAYYAQGDDYIRLPPIDSFIDAEHYYGTGLHELAHWTKHPTRLDRDFGRKKFGDEGYAQEEIVAELTSCFLAADLDLTPDPKDENAAYIQNWLQALKDDRKFIFRRAAEAQRSADYLVALQPKAPEPLITSAGLSL